MAVKKRKSSSKASSRSSSKTSKRTVSKKVKRPVKKKAQKKKAPKKPVYTIPSHIKREVLGLAVCFLAAFVYMGIRAPESTGYVGYWGIDVACRNMMGQGMFYLPLFLGIAGATLLAPMARWKQSLATLTVCFATFLIYLELIINRHVPTLIWPYPDNGGGWIGHVGLYGLDSVVGRNGTLLCLAAILIITPILVFNFSFVQAFLTFGGWLKRQTVFQSLMTQLRHGLFFTTVVEEEPVFAHTRPRVRQVDEDDDDEEEEDEHESPHFQLPDYIETVEIVDEAPAPAPRAKKRDVSENKLTFSSASEHMSESDKKKPLITSFLSKDSDTYDASKYKRPSLALLDQGKGLQAPSREIMEQQEAQSILLEETLKSFNVKARVVNVTMGPSVTRFELEPGDGVKVSKITALSKDLALKLAAPDVRIEAPIPGKSLVGIEVPNIATDVISLRMLLKEEPFFSKPSKLLTALGMTITGEAMYMDLGKMPHVLIAGATGSGKSVCVNTIILSILMKSSPEEVRFLMIDPKKVELSLYDGIPHLLAPVVTNPHKAAAALKEWALVEMERRYELFSSLGVKDLKGYNSKMESLRDLIHTNPDKALKTLKQAFPDAVNDPESLELWTKPLPCLVVIIDELADLMMVASQEVENTICRLAQMARATGIHLVVATQRPSVNVVTGLIKANVPSRISFFLQSQIDSRTILDATGAEKLLGKGDMLYMPVGAFKPKRLQGVFVSEKEVKTVVQFLKKQGGPAYEKSEEDIQALSLGKEESSSSKGNSDDEMYEEAKELVKSTQYASTSYLQRKLRIGYNRAARLMDELEENGVISAFDGEKKSRQVLS